jgi:hypothetical protein
MTHSEASSWVDVVVKVPANDVGDFYRMAGEWIVHRTATRREPTSNAAPIIAWGTDVNADEACAHGIVDKLSKKGRRLFDVLVEAGRPVTSTELAEALGFDDDKAPSMVAGTLAWPGRHAAAVGRKFPVAFSDDETPTTYWLKPGADKAFAKALAANNKDDLG